MNNKDEIFKKVYFDSFLISEDTINTTNNKNAENKTDNLNKTAIDELTEKNTVTIEDDAPINEKGNLETSQNIESSSNDNKNNEEFKDDGWGEDIVENLSELLDDLESFIYELKNCVRGSFTGCKTREELRNYMVENLAARLTEEAENI